MKRFLAALGCGALIVFCVLWLFPRAIAAEGPSSEDASALIRSLGDRVIHILEDPKLSQQGRIERFNTLLGDAFDWGEASAFSLGRYRASVNPTQFDEYRDVFRHYMVNIYAAKMASYSGQTFVVTGQRQTGQGHRDVTAEVRNGTGPAIPMTFRIGRSGGKLKVYDVVIQGVSLLATKRQEVTSVIARDGFDPLMARLKRASR